MGPPVDFECLVAGLMARFVRLAATQLVPEIEQALQRIAEYLVLDQAMVVQWNEDGDGIRSVVSWRAPGVSTASVACGPGAMPWIRGQMRKGSIVALSRPEDLHADATTDREFLRSHGVRALISLPVEVGHKTNAALILMDSRREVPWSEVTVQRLRLIADMFSGLLDRERRRTQLEERLQFETILADLSAHFINLPADRVDREIEDALRRLCEFLGAEICTLWQKSADAPADYELTHYYRLLDGPPVPKPMYAHENFPWTLQQIVAGRIVNVSTGDLPPEARRDREVSLHFGVQSSLSIPLSAGGQPFVGVLVFNTVMPGRIWPEVLVQRLRLVAQIFANALVRKGLDTSLRCAFEEVQRLRDRLEEENVYLQQEVKSLHGHGGVIGQSKAIRHSLALAEQVAPTASTVLLLGETGTGKELLAAAIHELSPRRMRPMVRVNCAAIPGTLMESELFGREKGAYTGALSRQAGSFELAHGSTVFLDEIGELPAELQAKLLRVLQEKTIQRLGNPKPIAVDVRVIAATNQDLSRAVREGRFRHDLFYRLNVFPITLPPLRERREDIPQLVWTFVEEFSKSMGKPIESVPRAAMDALQRNDWPGNVRELRNVVERAMILNTGPRLEIVLPTQSAVVSEVPSALPLELSAVERNHIYNVLQKTGWRIDGPGGAAELLGLKRTTLQSRMVKLGIKRPGQ